MPEDFPYNRFGQFLKDRYGEKVHKVSVDAGFSCPNRQGAGRGCAWCENSSFNPNPREKGRSVKEQVQLGVNLLRKRLGVRLFIAYFQSYTNTYANVELLEQYYKDALSVEGVIGIAVGTRPDSVDMEKISILESIAKNNFVQVEYGLQTANEKTLFDMNRGESVADYLAAMEISRDRGLELCTHMITGLPGDTVNDAHKTLDLIVESGATGIKIHNLHIVKGTTLAERYLQEKFPVQSMDEHVSLVCDLLEHLPWAINVQRLWGASASKDKHIAPDWCLNNNAVKFAIENEFKRRGTHQGSAIL